MTAPDTTPLDNAVWHSLTGPQRTFAEAEGLAARFDPDVSVFAALGEDTDAGWRDLASLVGPSGIAVLFRAEIPQLPAPWTRLDGGRGHQMVLRDLAPVDVPDARPWVRRTSARCSRWWNSPAPARSRRARWSSVGTSACSTATVWWRWPVNDSPRRGSGRSSAVCTHPDFRGRGLAAGLTALVARASRAR